MEVSLSYNVSVDEPWDYRNIDGTNIIKGEVIKIIDSFCVVFQASHMCLFEKVSGNILILSPRHEGYNFFDGWETRKSYITVNGSILSIPFEESMGIEEIRKRAVFVFIGSLNIGK